jgi:hypothetical protein
MAWTPGARDKANWMAVDASPSVRPGVPRQRIPMPDPGAHGVPPDAQRRGLPAQGGGVVARTTAVYGTGQPVHGVTGAIRRAAYRVPEHRVGRWLLLLAADRVEVLGRRAREAAWLVPVAAALAAGFFATSRAMGRR